MYRSLQHLMLCLGRRATVRVRETPFVAMAKVHHDLFDAACDAYYMGVMGSCALTLPFTPFQFKR
jgi:hypothetical protein